MWKLATRCRSCRAYSEWGEFPWKWPHQSQLVSCSSIPYQEY